MEAVGATASTSTIWRISIWDSVPIGFGQRLTHSIASSSDSTWKIQKPAISSFVSANGPSVTDRLPRQSELPAGLRTCPRHTPPADRASLAIVISRVDVVPPAAPGEPGQRRE